MPKKDLELARSPIARSALALLVARAPTRIMHSRSASKSWSIIVPYSIYDINVQATEVIFLRDL